MATNFQLHIQTEHFIIQAIHFCCGKLLTLKKEPKCLDTHGIKTIVITELLTQRMQNSPKLTNVMGYIPQHCSIGIKKTV